MNFPLTVKYLRKKLNISQEELARELKVSFATINRWENGKTKPNKMAQDVFTTFCRKNDVDIESMQSEEL